MGDVTALPRAACKSPQPLDRSASAVEGPPSSQLGRLPHVPSAATMPGDDHKRRYARLPPSTPNRIRWRLPGDMSWHAGCPSDSCDRSSQRGMSTDEVGQTAGPPDPVGLRGGRSTWGWPLSELD